MSERADAFEVRRWQESVASDPGSEDFLPLAEVYRREGRIAVAIRLCLRGLERNPDHIEAHVQLGRLYRESGELDQAFDEWDIALRLDPEHQPARRALGYLCLERRDWPAAVRHLEAAARAEPGDQRLAGALDMARRRASNTGLPEVDPSTALAAPLAHFAREARVRLAMIIDHTGRVVCRHGYASETDVASLATLGAGIHSASGELAGMLGQPRFEQLYQGAGDHQIFIAPLQTMAGELLLVAVFGVDATVGMVRVLFYELAGLAGELPLAAGRRPGPVDAASYEEALQGGLRSRETGS